MIRTAIVALGGNVGDVAGRMRTALAELGATRASRLYRSRPMYLTDQPPFLNAVALVPTAEGPLDFLRRLKAAEAAAGRIARERNGPRELDLDLVALDDLVVEGSDLVLPHPRLAERRFVLLPLVDLLPFWSHPATGDGVNDLLRRTADQADDLEPLPDALLQVPSPRPVR